MIDHSTIDLGNPVSDHPFNDTLLGWLLSLPGRGQGGTLFDLTGRYSGALVGQPSSAPGCPDGFAGILLNGTSQYVSLGLMSNAIFGASPSGVTVAWWMRPSTVHNAGTIRGVWGALSGTGQPEFGCQVYSDNNWYVGFAWAGDDDRVTTAATASNYPQGEWGFYTFTCTIGGASYLYRNGIEFGSKTSGSATYQTPSDVFRIGSNSVTYGNFFPGAIGSFLTYARALPAAEVRWLSAQAWLGYPDLIRRAARRRSARIPASVPTTDVYEALPMPGFGW